MTRIKKYQKRCWREHRDVTETEMPRMGGKLNHTFIARRWKTGKDRSY